MAGSTARPRAPVVLPEIVVVVDVRRAALVTAQAVPGAAPYTATVSALRLVPKHDTTRHSTAQHSTASGYRHTGAVTGKNNVKSKDEMRGRTVHRVYGLRSKLS